MGVAPERSHALYGNRAECYLRLKRWEEALADSRVSEEIKPDWSKAHYRQAQALCGLERWEEACNAYTRCLACEDVDFDIVSEKLAQVEQKAWRVTVKTLPVLGRCLVAADTFHPGQHVLHEAPFLHWSNQESDYDPQVTEICLKHGLALTSGVCGVLSVVPSLTRFQSQMLADLSTPDVELSSPVVVAWINAAAEIAGSGCSAVEYLNKDPYHVARLVLAVKTNSHRCALLRGAEERGGLFRLGSKLAHSCMPNVVYQPQGGSVHFTALRLIPSDTLATFSYRGELDFLARSNLVRQRELWGHFMFWCSCERCQGDDLCRQIKCGCSDDGVRVWRGAYSPPGVDCPAQKQWRCTSCDRQFADEQLPLADEARLEAVVQELEDSSGVAKTKYTSLKETLLEVLDVLGPRHWTFGALCKRLCNYFRGMAKANSSIVAVQMAIAFGAHYLRFLSRTRLYADSPLLACHFAASLASSIPLDHKAEPVFQTDDTKIMNFEEARNALLQYSLPLLDAVYGKENGVVQKAREMWQVSQLGDLPQAPKHPRDPLRLLPSPPAEVGLFVQWEATVVQLVASGGMTS
eukprot:TRINITY_DN14872_c0_g1_i2.p1 TRINITY_DN14872_c0_g1~~TRINITY_DN14872_c0_g1_i2.p1  ORF type:complete len:636 (+),score=265.55 TRINITY_DN14872_c0_g1_i2:177-1910(+)